MEVCVCVCMVVVVMVGASVLVSLHTRARALRCGVARGSLSIYDPRGARASIYDPSGRASLHAAVHIWDIPYSCPGETREKKRKRNQAGWYGGEGVYKHPGVSCCYPRIQLEPAAAKDPH